MITDELRAHTSGPSPSTNRAQVRRADKEYYERTGNDFRLNDDWKEIHAGFAVRPVLHDVVTTDFLQAVTLLATREAHLGRPPAISGRRETTLPYTVDTRLSTGLFGT